MFEKNKERQPHCGGRGETDYHEVGEVARAQIMQYHRSQGKGMGVMLSAQDASGRL